jgi:hypothetical protein
MLSMNRSGPNDSFSRYIGCTTDAAIRPMSRGRHARMMADPLVEKLGGEPFIWAAVAFTEYV